MSNHTNAVDLSPVMDAAAGIHEGLMDNFDATRLFVAVERLTQLVGQCADHTDSHADVMPAITCVELTIDSVEEMSQMIGATATDTDLDLEAAFGTSLFSEEDAVNADLMVASLQHRLAALRSDLAQAL